MADPIYDAHGITINDPADGYHTNSEINAFVDAIRSIPTSERIAYFNAVRRHWDHYHFVTAPDDIFLAPGRDGSIMIRSINFDYGELSGYDGLTIPPNV